jgi:prepilin-type N-terminal cleavage/methylation domain-containing protein
MSKAGFSLLEVILALAILAGVIAILGETNRMALRNAAMARDLARAQLLCETVLSQISTGEMTPDPVEQEPFDTTSEQLDPSEAPWVYSVASEQTDEPGLIAVRVTVTRDMPREQHPVEFAVVRWIPDPNYTPASESGATGSSSSSSSGGSSSGSSGGSSGTSGGSSKSGSTTGGAK